MKAPAAVLSAFVLAAVVASCGELTTPLPTSIDVPSKASLTALASYETWLFTTEQSPAYTQSLPTYTEPLVVQLEIHRKISIASHSNAWFSKYSGAIPPNGILIHGDYNRCFANVFFKWIDASNNVYQSGPGACRTIPVGVEPWYDTLLVKGSGSAIRNGGVPDIPGQCAPASACHTYSGMQRVVVTPLAIPLGLQVSTRYITPVTGTFVTFKAVGIPDYVGMRAHKVPVSGVTWSWTKAGGGTPQTIACSPGVNPCQATVREAGTMTVTARVNGVDQTTSVQMEAVPCATGDSLIDKPLNRTALADMWSLSNATGPIDDRRERRGVIFDSTYWISPLTPPYAGPCLSGLSGSQLPQGTPRIDAHVHPFAKGDSLPAACKRADAAPNQISYYGGDYGGPSGPDWKSAWDNDLPMLVVDTDSVYRIYPHPIDSTLVKDQEYKYFPKPNWETKYKAVKRVSGSCVLL